MTNEKLNFNVSWIWNEIHSHAPSRKKKEKRKIQGKKYFCGLWKEKFRFKFFNSSAFYHFFGVLNLVWVAHLRYIYNSKSESSLLTFFTLFFFLFFFCIIRKIEIQLTFHASTFLIEKKRLFPLPKNNHHIIIKYKSFTQTIYISLASKMINSKDSRPNVNFVFLPLIESLIYK
jgi:hypothetical protein